MSKVTRPILRYHGGKWRLAPWIISHFPKHRVYVEAYAGAGSVLLQKSRCYAEIYNDLDGEICNVFRVLRDPCQALELERQLRLTPFARDEFESAFLQDGNPIEQARRTIIKSYMGFGSDSITARSQTGFRSNCNRSYSTPAHDWAKYPGLVASFAQRLSAVIIESRPAISLIETYDSETTLFYLDPPYPHETRQGGGQHRYRYEMTNEDHRELAEVLQEVKGKVILSGYPCDLYDLELYRDWKRVEKPTHGDGACDRIEVLWINPAAAQFMQTCLNFAA